MYKVVIIILSFFCCTQCSSKNALPSNTTLIKQEKQLEPKVIVGAAQLDLLLPKLIGKKVALLVNHTALVGKTHLADTLKSLGITIQKILAPEHGFRGTADAGEHVSDDMDSKTGIPIVSLYGKRKKPTAEQLADVDVVIFDIQDIGVRYFTYIGTMHYLMETCAISGKKLIIPDRPNPNGSYIDGPVLLPEFKSFYYIHPVPVAHGMTVGEFALMINGEGWLEGGKKCDLEVIPVENWKHDDFYSIPVKPSPNMPNDQAIKLYPSVCLFEGTVISVGRGTQTPFQVVGHPDLKNQPYSFTPVSINGMAKSPPYENKICYGLDLTNVTIEPKLTVKYLIELYAAYPDKEKFFNNYFNTLAGTSVLKQQIKDGLTDDQIRETWKKDLDIYKETRKKYLLYP